MTAAHRRKVHVVLTAIWLLPGAVFAYWLRHSIPWVTFMSWYAIVVSHVAGWAAETPVEVESPT